MKKLSLASAIVLITAVLFSTSQSAHAHGLHELNSSAAPSVASQASGAASSATPGVITKIRQLTFEGLRAGEGYFSHDGKLLVYQSERLAENPFYQIFF